jgi:pimeloyl-ACP methyl ester carboxylesterase
MRTVTLTRKNLKHLVLGMAAFSSAVLASTAARAQAAPVHGAKAVTCHRLPAIPVALSSGQAATYTINGELCTTADERRAGTTVQVLVHGAFYNHDYWDFGKVDGIRYSYARAVAARGFPTFAFDLLGAGASSHPASDQLTAQAEAYVTHQVIQGLRSGSIGGIRFGKVILVGHSLGSTVVWQEAISYGDVDGVIITGAAHSLAARFGTLAGTDFYPAVKDPKFATSGLDAGYLTTVPGTRSVLFFNPADADSTVIAADEARKDVVPSTELGTGIPVATSKDSLAIHVPVLDILGSNDATTCGPNGQGVTFDCSSGAAVARQEAPFYSAQAHIHACVVPGSGHDISLALNHGLQVRDAVAWSRAYVGRAHVGKKSRFVKNSQALPQNCG